MTATTEEKVKENDPIDPLVQEVLDNHWKFKEIRVASDFEDHPGDGGPIGGDMVPFVTFSNEDGTQVRLEYACPRIDKRDAIAVANLIAPLLQSDWLLATMDTHISYNPTNPATGEPWKPGEMQKACDEDGACSTGIITDAITAMLVRRDGTVQMVSRTYHVDKAKGEIHWVDVTSMDTRGKDPEANQVTGFVAENLMRAFQRKGPQENEKAMADEAGIPLDDRPTYMLVSTCQLALNVIAGAAMPYFTDEEIERNGDYITKQMTEEAVARLGERLGPISAMLRAKWGLDS